MICSEHCRGVKLVTGHVTRKCERTYVATTHGFGMAKLTTTYTSRTTFNNLHITFIQIWTPPSAFLALLPLQLLNLFCLAFCIIGGRWTWSYESNMACGCVLRKKSGINVVDQSSGSSDMRFTVGDYSQQWRIKRRSK